MKVFLLKDVEKIGLSGEILKVRDGFALNFLIPRKLAVEITPENTHLYEHKVREVHHRKQVIESKTSMLAEKIGSLKLLLKRKIHDTGKLYGAIGANEVVDLLSGEGIKVAKNQVIFDKSIKELGSYEITIKLSNTLQPKCTLKIVAEQA
jgi:large subunit ribosomal protein L9